MVGSLLPMSGSLLTRYLAPFGEGSEGMLQLLIVLSDLLTEGAHRAGECESGVEVSLW